MKNLVLIFLLLGIVSSGFAADFQMNVDINLYDLHQAGIIEANESQRQWRLEVIDTDTLEVVYSTLRNVQPFSIKHELGFFWETPIPGIFKVVESTGEIKLSRKINVPQEGRNVCINLVNVKRDEAYTLAEIALSDTSETQTQVVAPSYRDFGAGSEIIFKRLE